MSEVSSSGGLDEKEQICLPKDLFHDFESLKNVTNLTTVDLMRKLLGEYQNDPGAVSAMAEMEMRQSYPPSSVVTSSVRSVAGTPRGRAGRKSRIPGQKLKQVCEILHGKHAAREIAEQKKQEALDRNCNSAGSSSSGTVTSMEEAVLVNCDFQPVDVHSESREKLPYPHTVSQAPFAHVNNSQDAVHLRKLLGTRPIASHGDYRHGSSIKDVGMDDMVLDLSVHKTSNLDQPKGMSLPHVPSVSPETAEVTDRRVDDNSVAIHGQREVLLSDRLDAPSAPSMLERQCQNSRMFVYSSSPVPRDGGLHPPAMCTTSSELPQVVPPLIQPAAPIKPEIDSIAAMSREVMGLSRMRTRAKRPVTRKAPVNEGMKLINENNLYPGVYTSTFKLPGSRRGRRSAANKQLSQQAQAANDSAGVAPSAATAQQNVMIPMQVPNGSQQPYMMLCPQVAVSSVLVKSPRKRGRPPKRPSISQFHGPPEHQAPPSQMVLPQPHMTITMPNAGNAGMVSSDNGAVSYLYQPQTDQPPVSFPQQVLQQQQQQQQLQQNMNRENNTATPVHPNHNQLVNILNQATSINACNPIFVPNSSLQSCMPTALPTNAAGIITLPLQNLTGDPQTMVQSAPPSLVPSPVFAIQEGCQKDSQLSPSTEAPSPESTVANSNEALKPPDSGVFQEMILSPQALVNVKPRSKPTTTELIRSNSNFYCGSFKIRPQKPNTQTGQGGAPLKRGRGRPRLNVFESSRQKETKESRSKMYQELFHCKVCNEIVWAGERLSHQRKHVSVKLICISCGIEFQSYKNATSPSKGIQNQQCPQCKKLYDYDLSHPGESSNTEGVECGSVEKDYEAIEELSELRASSADLTCPICGTISRSPAAYAQHMNEHQDDGLTCSEEGCCERFRNSSELRRHVKHMHPKGKEHPCMYDGCDKKFMKNFHLQEHIRVKHFNIKAFKCPWPTCQKEFAGIRHLKVHMLIHRGEKPLKCEFCDYRCRQRNALNWHMRKHPEVSSQCNDGHHGDTSDQDEGGMMIDLSLLAADSVSDELSPHGYEHENEEEMSSPESFSDFSPVTDHNTVHSTHHQLVEDE